MDRRALFASGAAAALLAATGISTLPKPSRGGHLRVAVPHDGTVEAVAQRSTTDTLTEIDPNGLLVGELALDWAGSPDAKEWFFNLRADVRSHSGAQATASVVAEALVGALQASPVRAISVESDLSLRFILSRPTPDFPVLLSEARFSIGAGSETGLYRPLLADDRHFVGLRIDRHYKDGVSGWADKVELLAIPDDAIRAEALFDGYVDVALDGRVSEANDRRDIALMRGAHGSTVAYRHGVGVPITLGSADVLDDCRVAERWWLV